MFDEFLSNPLLVMLPTILSVVVGFLLSRAVELVPAFAVWWAALSGDNKRAVRGWAGLPLVLLLVAFAHFAELYPLVLQSLADWLLLTGVLLVSWLFYVASAEGTYRAAAALNVIPRYTDDWRREHLTQ